MSVEQARLDVRGYYLEKYRTTTPGDHEWNTGTAMPELVNLVMSGRIAPGSRILDIGCGIGTESVFLASRGFAVSALDISPNAIERGRGLADVYGVSVSWRVGDVLDLPYEAGTFDVVTDRGCFHCLRDHERPGFSEQLARVLVPGGLYVLRCFSAQRPGRPWPDVSRDFVTRTFGVGSEELWDTFGTRFTCERMELVSSFADEDRPEPYGWYSLWYRKP